MKKTALRIAVVLGWSVYVASPAWVYAQAASPISGGSNAADYQPPTDNPQDDAGANLQTPAGDLQPLPGKDNFTQQNLSGRQDLRVVGTTGEANPNTTSTSANPDNGTSASRLPIAIIGVLTVAAIVYLVIQPEPSKRKAKRAQSVIRMTTLDAKSDAQSAPKQPVIVSKKPKKKIKKKHPKKRK